VINEKYVPASNTASTSAKIDSNGVTDEQRVYGAIEGMTRSLGDPYTVFFPPVESKSFAQAISGNFGGVGMEVGSKDGVITVISPLKDSPAAKAGMKAGDKIVRINATSTQDMSVETAVGFIRGEVGTTVKLTVYRANIKDPFEVSIVRDTINIPTIDTETKGDVFIIHMYNFSAVSPNLFRDALRTFVESGKTKMILDLRGNPGGYLEAAIDMASWFLPAGKVVVKEDFRNAEDAQVYRSKGYNIFNDNLKMVVLIDGGSASASEILAGALHEHGVATLVGTQSFGKGSVQELVDITKDTSLKVTIARWLTPNGISISHGGLTPDVVVKLDEEKFKAGKDNQIEKAIEILDK
jgi:carboxyl-terminal processing protease